MGILRVNINIINLSDTNSNKDDPETIIHVKPLAWHSKLEKRKAIKKG